MENKYNIEKFRELLKKAIGDRTQKEFAVLASLSYSNLNRMLKLDTNGVPSRTSLIKISQASQGRVTLQQLYYACGYDVKNAETELADAEAVHDGAVPDKNIPEGAQKCASRAVELKDALLKICGYAQKYDSVSSILETALLMVGKPNVRASFYKPGEYTGTGRRGAEHYAHAKYKWYEAGFDAVLSFVVFYSVTEKGGCIFSDCAFDLSSLLELNNPDAGRYLFKISALGDVSYADYPIVCNIEKHVPGEAEKRLLAAIFGDLMNDTKANNEEHDAGADKAEDDNTP